MTRAALIGMVCVAVTAPSSAASKYVDIEPGWSTRSAAVKALGEPVFAISDELLEFAAQEGTQPIFVELRGAGDAVVDRVEVRLAASWDRAHVIKEMELTGDPVLAHVPTGGGLMEYFGGGLSLVLTYKGGHAASGVVSIGYYSDDLFERERRRAQELLDAGIGRPAAPQTPETVTPTETPVTPVRPEVPGTFPPSIKRNHLACHQLYLWAEAEQDAARRAKQVPRRQSAMAIRLAAQAGDCTRANALTDDYKRRFGAGK